MDDVMIEFLPNQLYFTTMKNSNYTKLKNVSNTFYFCIDEELVYRNYYYDFGPLNISCLYKYCSKLNYYLKYFSGMKKIVHYASNNIQKKTNAAFLIGSFAIIYLNMKPNVVYRKLSALEPYKPFIDAGQHPTNYIIDILDCFHALTKAVVFNFFDFNDFNEAEYDLRDDIQNGNLNWIVPRKFLAFIGPTHNHVINRQRPQFYLKYFLINDVTTVIRLNNKAYDASIFLKNGIQHYDLFFPDGTAPTNEILIKFLKIAEKTAPGAIAVHCKAGLGRTGTLIGAYLMKHYQMTAKESIAWLRICRPGSVIGQQQEWLQKLTSVLLLRDKIPCHKYGIYSIKWPIERTRILEEMKRERIRLQIAKQQKSTTEDELKENKSNEKLQSQQNVDKKTFSNEK